MKLRLAWVVAVSVLVGACFFPLTDKSDGSSCSDDDDCKSARCHEGFCSGSSCKLSNPSSCNAGWKCTHNEPDPITGFFGNDGSDTCKPTCGHCPGNMHCPADADAEEGALCRHGKAPIALSIVAEDAIVGRPAKLRAVAEGAGRLVECKWELGDGKPSETTAGGELTRTFDTPRDYSARVSCTDDGGRRGFAESSITVTCTPSGEACAPGACCADKTMRCVSGTCRVPSPPVIEITGPLAVALDEEVTYTVALVGGDGTLRSASWKFEDSLSTESGLTVMHAFDTAGAMSVTANVGTDIDTKAAKTITVNVCQKDGGRCDSGAVTCCAPLTCQGAGIKTCRP